MRFEDQLFLIQTRGLAADSVRQYYLDAARQLERGEPRDLATEAGRRRLLADLGSASLARGQTVTWPTSFAAVARVAALLRRAGVRLAWRGESDYPKKIENEMDAEAPAWLWLAGNEARLAGPAAAMIDRPGRPSGGCRRGGRR